MGILKTSSTGSTFYRLQFKKETEVGVFEKLVGIANATDLEISHFVETGNQNDLSASIQSVSRLLNIANKYVSERTSVFGSLN